MNIQNIQKLIQDNYDITVQNIEIFRGTIGCHCTYIVYGTDKKYFFKAVNNLASFEMETALASVDIQLYLIKNGMAIRNIIQ